MLPKVNLNYILSHCFNNLSLFEKKYTYFDVLTNILKLKHMIVILIVILYLIVLDCNFNCSVLLSITFKVNIYLHYIET